MKKCIKCQVEKPITEYHKWNQRTDGYRPECKSCRKLDSKKYYNKYRNSLIERQRKNREINPNYFLEYYKNNIEYFEKYYINHTEHYKNWRTVNKDRLWKLRKQRIKNDPELKILCNLRSYVSTKIRRFDGIKCDKTVNLLGCSILDFRNHLQSKFQIGMTWENYGRKGWHIDHIKPCDSFNLKEESEQRKCFHFSNMQPMWAIDNLKKGCKF